MYNVLQLFGVMMAIFVPICMLVFITEYFKYKRNTNTQLEELQKDLEQNSTSELEAEISELKERIIVLETIVTDRGFELERKISNL